MIKMFQASDVCALTGLSQHQLREWCGRRRIVMPDVASAGRGRHALFSWQTMVALRILKDLHESYGVEVQAWAPGVKAFRELLGKSSFISLWGKSIVFEDSTTATWLSDGRQVPARSLVVALDPHLKALQMSDPFEPGMQFPMFRAVGVS